MNNRKSLLRLLLLVSFCLATVTLHAQVINKTFKNETLKTVLNRRIAGASRFCRRRTFRSSPL